MTLKHINYESNYYLTVLCFNIRYSNAETKISWVSNKNLAEQKYIDHQKYFFYDSSPHVIDI